MQREAFGKLLIIFKEEEWIKSEGTGREVVGFYVCGKQMGEWKEPSGYDDA